MIFLNPALAAKQAAPNRSLHACFTKTAHATVRQRGFTLVELLVVIAIIGILVALLLPAIQAAREAARRTQCESNLHNAGLAVLNFESARKTLPQGMTFNPAYVSSKNINTLDAFGPNWIISILPNMEEQALHDSFDPSLYLPPDNAGFRPVNDNPVIAANQKARASTIPSLLCPSDPYNRTLYQGGAATTAHHGAAWGRTNYAANAGRSFIYGSASAPAASYNFGPDSLPWKDPCFRGVMGPNEAVTLRRISDGTTKTIMLGEIRTGLTENDGRGVWAMGHAGASLIAMCGGGSDDNGPNCQLSNGDDVYCDANEVDGTGVCVARTSTISLAEGTSAGGGASFDQATVRSKHPGGAFVAMCDGSVTFVNDDIETTGCYGTATCCTAWDYMITSGDEGKLGSYNGAPTGRGAATPCP